MVQAVLTPSNLGVDFDIGVTTPNAINVKVATTSSSGKISRLATTADVTAGTVGVIPDAALLKTAIAGVTAGTLLSFRNRLRNAQFSINQRGVTSPVSVGAQVYTLDGVKGGSSGVNFSFSSSGIDTTIIITSGTVVLPIEGLLIEGGSYTLSWVGTATARVYQGSAGSSGNAYAASPINVSGFTAGTNTFVEFSTGTVATPQLEPGTVPTVFERRPYHLEVLLGYRYLWVYSPTGNDFFWAFGLSGPLVYVLRYPVQMRVSPSISISGSTSGAFSSGYPAVTSSNNQAAAMRGDTTAGGNYSFLTAFTAFAEV